MPPAPKRTISHFTPFTHSSFNRRSLSTSFFFQLYKFFFITSPLFFFGFWRWLCFFCVGIFLVHFFFLHKERKEWREGEIRDFLGKRDISSFFRHQSSSGRREEEVCVGLWNRDMSVTSFVTVALTCCSFFFRAKKGGGTFLGTREKQIKHLLFFFFFQLSLQINHV